METPPAIAVRSIQKEVILEGSTDNETLAQIIVRTAYATESFHSRPPNWGHSHEFEVKGTAIVRGVSFPASHTYIDEGDFSEKFEMAGQGIRLAMERFDGSPPGRAEFSVSVSEGLSLKGKLIFAEGKRLGYVLNLVSQQDNERLVFTLPPSMEFKSIVDALKS